MRLANDANCFALSEATDGAAAGQPVVFGVILGTGVGGGVVVDGRVVDGRQRDRRRVGPQPAAVAGGRRAARGRRATAAAPAASRRSSPGPAWRAITQAATGRDVDAGRASSPRPTAGDARRRRRSSATSVGSRAALADGHQRARSRRRSSSAAALSNIERLYERVPRLWSEFVFSDAIVTRLVRAAHGDSSGVRGAAWLWNRRRNRLLTARDAGRIRWRLSCHPIIVLQAQAEVERLLGLFRADAERARR